MGDSSGAKERIMQTVVRMLTDKKDISKLTNRQIAEMACVNSALINYYYQSKENLFRLAVEECMGEVFKEIIQKSTGDGQPVVRLKSMVKAIAEVACSNYSLAEHAFKFDMKNGSMGTNQMILSLLKEIYGDTKTDTELKLVGLQLIIPLQSLFLNANDFKNYLLCDLFNTNMRNEIIDKMVDNIFPEAGLL